MLSKAFIIQKPSDSWDFPSSPTLSKSAVTLRNLLRSLEAAAAHSRSTFELALSPQSTHAHRTASRLDGPQRSRCGSGLPDVPRRPGPRCPTAPRARDYFRQDLGEERPGAPGLHSAHATGYGHRLPGARTSRAGRKVPPTRRALSPPSSPRSPSLPRGAGVASQQTGFRAGRLNPPLRSSSIKPARQAPTGASDSSPASPRPTCSRV